MSSNLGKEIIEPVKPHSIPKFRLIARYVTDWANRLANFDNCEGLVYIDCMSNSGYYKTADGKIIEGTAPLVVNVLNNIQFRKGLKPVDIYFNDLNEDKCNYLKRRIEEMELNENLHVHYSHIDANAWLEAFASNKLNDYRNFNTLLLYDPFDASIDWNAITPFFGVWGEVIINHMSSDTVRAISQVKKEEKIAKYELTYQKSIEQLLNEKLSKEDLEKIVETIIRERSGACKKVYIATFPFFVSNNNSLLYNLIHVGNHPDGFNLFKKAAWKTFDSKSSDKHTHGAENQMRLNFDTPENAASLMSEPMHNCYFVHDIAQYIYNKYNSQGQVFIKDVEQDLAEHPVFPYEGFKREIAGELRKLNVETKQDRYIFGSAK